MNRITLITILLFVVATVADQHIPKHIRQKFKSSSTFHDFISDFHVLYHPEHTNRHISKNLSPTAMPVRLNSANLMGKPKNRMALRGREDVTEDNIHIDDHTMNHLQMLREIRQGNDTCKLQSVCVPVPIVSDDPSVLIYPRCYEVNQCVGSCCDSTETCHPHTINYVFKPIMEMIYVGNNRFTLNSTRNITMEEHTSCSCFDCGANTPSCDPGFVVGRNCKCECGNKADRNSCQGHERWNSSKCRCECALKCGYGEHLNERRCECRRRHWANSTIAREHVVSADDVASLPKLRVAVIGGHN